MAQPIAALLGALSLAAAPARPAPAAAPRFLFDIATATGGSESTWASLTYDRAHDELLVVSGGQVHLFNAAAMETYAFGGDGDLGVVERVGLLDGGDLLVVSNVEGRCALVRCDYRGERKGPFEVKPLPGELAGFDPDRIVVQGGKVYLAQTGPMRVVVTDQQGQVERVHDLAALVRAQAPGLGGGMSGFWVDGQGNLIFTMPYAFAAFVLSPSGELRRFGVRGSAPGKFNIAGAVASDEQGNVFVLDRLRSVVLMFDPALKFVVEFGYRGDGPGSLVAPFDLAVGNGKVFVSQARHRGVKVFRYQTPARTAGAGGAGG